MSSFDLRLHLWSQGNCFSTVRWDNGGIITILKNIARPFKTWLIIIIMMYMSRKGRVANPVVRRFVHWSCASGDCWLGSLPDELCKAWGKGSLIGGVWTGDLRVNDARWVWNFDQKTPGGDFPPTSSDREGTPDGQVGPVKNEKS